MLQSIINVVSLGLEDSETSDEALNLPTMTSSLKKRWTALLGTISVEPVMFLFSLGFALINIQMPTLYVQKTCKVGSYFWSNHTFSHEVRKGLENIINMLGLRSVKLSKQVGRQESSPKVVLKFSELDVSYSLIEIVKWFSSEIVRLS